MENLFLTPKRIVGVKLKDKIKVMESQSGGAFTAIAEYFLKNGGIIYGCGLDAELRAVYKRIDNIGDLVQIKGSKYVQAELKNTFMQVKADIESNKVVLFSGTPCYVAGIKKYLEKHKNKDNLYTIDIICHGVPSPLVYRNYLTELQNSSGKRITNFIFRDKAGGQKHMEKIIYEDGEEERRDDYINLFYTNLPLRPSCGVCRFASQERVGDFTVGDFWGVHNLFPEFNDEKGVSIVLINSNRALKIFVEIEDTLELMETNIENAMQPNLMEPTKLSLFRKIFWKDFKRKGLLYCAKKWIPIMEFPILLKSKVKRILKG